MSELTEKVKMLLLENAPMNRGIEEDEALLECVDQIDALYQSYYKGLAENGREEIAKIIIKELIHEMWTEPAPEEYWEDGMVVYHNAFAQESLDKAINKIRPILGAMVEAEIQKRGLVKLAEIDDKIETLFANNRHMSWGDWLNIKSEL